MNKNLVLFPELADALDRAWDKWKEDIDNWLKAPWQQEAPQLQPVRLREEPDNLQ